MDAHLIERIAQELTLRLSNVRATVELLDDKATVPFIARYRKEVTGSLDEVTITSIRDRLQQLRELEKRRAAILESLTERNQLTDELKEKILAAQTMAVLEDIYLPFRPKRRTRATVAREKGLELLAQKIFTQENFDVYAEAAKYINVEKGVKAVDEALAGARDIIAEWVNEDAEIRAAIRELYLKSGKFKTTVIRGKEDEGANFRDYFDWEESVVTAPSHRILAARRGEHESVLMLHVVVDEEKALQILEDHVLRGDHPAADQVYLALQDCFKRLLSLSMETEVRTLTKERADKEAIKVFTENLRELLMAPPLGPKMVMAIDPGYRTGCKVVCLDQQGKLLTNTTVFPAGSDSQREEATAVIRKLCEKHQIEFIAVGNGTASRETEDFIRSLGLPQSIQTLIVNESGASIYSASDVAREEFPDHDVTVRGSVSIGRRLMDPLSELVKIDPKSIGVGQYQHDVDQQLLKNSLDDTVISCVNQVGVELNSASKQLLTYVSGFGPARAQAVIDFRNANGPFRSRKQLFEVDKLGSKAVEQAAGFLRIRDGENPLDASAVHPESYPIVEAMTKDANCRVSDLMKNDALRARIDLKKYVTETAGLPTLSDIMQELAKPGRDPRKKFEIFRFKEDVHTPADLTPGMQLPGIITNVTNFGCFVDVGVHCDGLVHISQMSDGFVKHPADLVKVHQEVQVTVLEVDLQRNRIALTMKKKPDQHFGGKKKKGG